VLTLPLSLQGRVVTGLLDSGAQLSVIDRGLARAMALRGLPLPIIALGLSGSPQIGPAADLEVRAGSLSLRGLRAAELDLSGIGVPEETAFSLILGQNALAAVVLDIDFPRRRLALHLPEGYEPPLGAVAVPSRLDRGRLMAQVRVAGQPLEVVVDTGASAVLALASDTAAKAGLLAGRAAQAGSSVTLGGAAPGRTIMLPDLQVGDAAFSPAPVQIYEPPAERMLRPFLPSGLLGLGALKPFRAILDLGRGRLYLLRGRRASA
jgi:predicted aspartyl protease